MSNKTNVNIGGGWLFLQCALLVVHYGFNKTLPWWVLWLPTIVVGSILVCVLFVLLIALLVVLVKR